MDIVAEVKKIVDSQETKTVELDVVATQLKLTGQRIVANLKKLEAAGVAYSDGILSVPGAQEVSTAEAPVEAVAAVEGEDLTAETTTVEAAEPAEQTAPTSRVGVTNPNSKAAKALAIFNDMPGKTRKEVMARFQTELGMSDAGAATYYQNIRKKLNLVGTR
jgi:hypothetical protein